MKRTIRDVLHFTLLPVVVLHPLVCLLLLLFISVLFVVQLLISHGASVNRQDDIGNTPLHLGMSSHLSYN